jgi:hypothetical protein
MDHNSVAFMYLKNKFLTICDAKIKEGVFIVPQIREIMLDIKFEDQLSEVEKTSMEIIPKCHCQFVGPLQSRKLLLLRWLMLYCPTERWNVICLYTCISWTLT